MVAQDRSAGRKPLDLPLETFSKVVEAIYDCALYPERWHPTVRMIADLCESQVCIVGVYDYASRRGELAYQCGYTEHFTRLYYEKYKDFDPFFVAGQLVPIGTVKTQAMLVDDAEFYEGRFYREWCKPQGLHDMMTFKILQTGQRIGWLAANRMVTCPRYGEAEVRLLTLLAPHICRAIAISDALNLKTIRSDALEATLNGLAAGVYLIDSFGRVIYMNEAAEHQVRKANALRIENDQLAPIDRLARGTMSKAIAAASTDEAEIPAGGFTIALPAGEDRGLVATILPLTRGERRNVCGAFAATAAVFVQDPVVVPQFPGEAFAKLYGLTGSELRVLLAMAPGLSAKEAAEVLGISETTAKTHLQRIYAKTETSKQTELMHLFMSSMPPVQGT
jgi:DNA-binding CsgD family transcriptional regulator/PAS domain-containing protein